MSFLKGPIFMGIAILVGLVAMFVVHSYITAKTKVADKPMSQVIIATADISPGNVITKGAVKAVSWPQELVPPKAANSLGQLEGRIVGTPVNAGEPVLLTKLAPEGTSAGLAALLTEGKRALSVRVDDVSGVAGFIHPGDHVDILVEMALGDSKEHFSKTVLQNITVLTAGQTWEQVKDQKPSIVNTVTLVLDNEQAEIMNLASNQGKIRLALRNRNDTAPVATRGVDTATLFGIERVDKKVPASPVTPVAKDKGHVEVIKGLDRSQANL